MPKVQRTPTALDVPLGYGAATVVFLAAVTVLLSSHSSARLLVAAALTLAAALLVFASAVHRLATERRIANDRAGFELLRQAKAQGGLITSPLPDSSRE